MNDSLTHLCKVCNRPVHLKPSATSSATDDGLNVAGRTKPICDACKKFYWRYHTRPSQDDAETCTCNAKTGTPVDITKCRPCRYRKFNQVVEMMSSSSGLGEMAAKRRQHQSSRCDFSKIPCKICGCSSSGIHFGVVSCEGCKGFFRRSMSNNYRKKYYCKKVRAGLAPLASGTLNCEPSSNCRQCRLQRCVDAGMSLAEVVIGRHTNSVRKEIDATLKKLSSSKSLLQKPLLRRVRRRPDNRSSEDDDETAVSSDRDNAMEESSLSVPVDSDDSAASSITQPGLIISQTENTPSRIVADETANVLMEARGSGDSRSRISSQFSGQSSATTSGYGSISIPSVPQPVSLAENTSLEVALASAQPAYRNMLNPHVEASEWLIDRAVEAVSRLAPITSLKVVFTPNMTPFDMVKQRSGVIDTYIRSVSEFLTMLPGTNQVYMPDRVILFLSAFFPVVSAELSLSFDVDNQQPNHMSLDRPSGTWAMQTAVPTHSLVERFLTDAGNQLSSTITNLKEFAIFCALLCLSHDASPDIANAEAIRAIRTRYELALIHYTSTMDGSEYKLSEFYRLLSFFRRAISVFYAHLHNLPQRCAANYTTACSPLFRETIGQFVNIAATTCDVQYY